MESLKAAPPQENRLHFLDYWRIIRIRKTVILAVFLLVVITSVLVTFILPESFASAARIKVDRDVTDISPMADRQMYAGYDPYFIQTEFEVIGSETILGKVIDSLDLNREWGKKYGNGDRLRHTETMTILKNRMDLRPVRNTSLIEIRIYSEKSEEAAKIANAIAEAYQAYRLDERRSLSGSGIKTLQNQFDEQEQKIGKMREELDKLRSELNISETDANNSSPTPMMEQETVRRFEGLRIEGQADYSRQLQLYESLTNYTKTELREVLPTALPMPDQLLNSYLEQLTLAEQKLITLQKDLGEDHPTLQGAKKVVDSLQAKIDERVRGIMAGLLVGVNRLKSGIDSLQSEVEKARKTDIDKAEKSRPYFTKKADLDRLLRFRDLLNVKLQSEKIDYELPKSGMVTIIEHAVATLRPVKPNKPLNIALGVVIGLIVGVGLAFFIEYLDTSVKTIDDVERALGAPVLGVIPQSVGLLTEEGAESAHAEAYRVLRTNLLFSRKDDKLNSLCVVSAGAGEGKSTTVFNLAYTFAQSGQRVLIIDSDLRRPTLHKMFKVTNNIGLTNYLMRQNPLEEVIQTSSIPTLDFIPSGKLPSSSMGILSSGQMKELITECKRRYDFVFFDSPPIMGVSDASILASELDMTIQVIQYRRYPQPMNIRAKQMIEKVGGHLVGIVLNNINMSQDESYYYYSGYYHDYYYTKSDDASEKSGKPGKAAKSAAAKEKLELKDKA